HPLSFLLFTFFFFPHSAPTEIYTLSLHDALPIYARCNRASTGSRYRRQWPFRFRSRYGCAQNQSRRVQPATGMPSPKFVSGSKRSEEHTSELQSPYDLVCRLLLEKKKILKQKIQ